MHAAMILCAGLGTRLRPLTEELPKPLVPVGDRPAVAHVVERIRAGVPGIGLVVNAHHRAAEIRAWASGEGIAVSEEGELLGTAGGLAAAGPLLSEGDVLVWNGDILSDLDVGVLAGFRRERRGDASLAVAPLPKGEGNVGLDPEGRIVRLRRESFGEETKGGAFLGIHVVSARLRASLPRTGCLVGDVYLPALRAGRPLHALETGATFLDVGTLAAYLEANRRWLAGRPSYAHPEALVEAELEGSVVGRGARVRAPAIRSVVWPGAVVERPVTDAIVTPQRIVQVG